MMHEGKISEIAKVDDTFSRSKKARRQIYQLLDHVTRYQLGKHVHSEQKRNVVFF